MTMPQLNPSCTAIEQILEKARNFDDTIGSYQHHSILQNEFTYSIMLSNGIISLYEEELVDIKSLPKERYRDIAARFRTRTTFLS
jgi:hypothetical protein